MPSFSTLATAATLAALAAAQSSSPTPTQTGNDASVTTAALPMFFFFGASLGASVVTSTKSSTVLALSCLDKSGCPNPTTGAFTVSRSLIEFNYQDSGYTCPITESAVTCTLSATGKTRTTVQQLSELLPDAVPTTEGVVQAVVISGINPSTTSSSSASNTGSSSGSSSRSGSSMPTSTGSSTGSMMPSSSASGSRAVPSPSASSTSNRAEHLVAGTGLLGAAALLLGAVVA